MAMRVNKYNAETKKKKRFLNIDSTNRSMLNIVKIAWFDFSQLNNLMPSDLQIALVFPK